VGVYIDDVYLSRIRGNQLDLLDVERLEVLRGPQGTLYGKNTIGGAIKFVTRKPGQDFRANASIGVGDYGQFDVKAAVSGPLSKTLALGVSVLRSTNNGFVRDPVLDRRYNDKNTYGGRAALAFTPNDKLRVDLTADYTRDKAALNVGVPLNNLVSAFGVVLPVTDVNGKDYDWKGTTTPGLPNSTKLKHYGFSGTLAYDLTDALTFRSITAYRNLKTDDFIDIDATKWQVGDVFVGVKQHQTSQEFQLTLSGDKLSGVAGLYYLNEKVDSHQEAYAQDYLRFSTAIPGYTFTRYIDDTLNTNSYAAYGNVSYTIVPKVRLSGGLRYTHETKDYDRLTTITSNFPLPIFPPYAFNPPKGKWNDLSPMASIDYQVTPATMLYARVAKGFKSGGFNGRANSAKESSAYKPEKVISYEAGFKTTLASQLRLNGAVFYNDYKDFQARVGDVDNTTAVPTPLLTVLNVGKLNIKGAELEANWTPIEGLLLDAQIGYLDAKYKEFFDNRFPNGSRAFQTPAFSPKWTMRYGAQYAFGLGDAGGLTLGAQARYKSRTALAVDNTYITYPAGNTAGVGTTTEVPGLFQSAYWTYDARLVWENQSKRFAVGLYGYNLSNKAYKTDAQEFSSVGNIRTVYYGNPRTVLARLTVRY
jgi:iron complex outermembrane receptor protein